MKIRAVGKPGYKLGQQLNTALYVLHIDRLHRRMHVPHRNGYEGAGDAAFRLENQISVGACRARRCFVLNWNLQFLRDRRETFDY